ncbi:beta-galactosidase GalA [Paenibacillus yanchengensis]|uniref:Beta-galactosidase GalA n=1 Tax=Paenibacillus yanchengensis TaxID=2035833 RepID=A0ABW4YFE6_9BACL
MKELEQVRQKQLFNANWDFYKGDISIPYSVKAGMTGGITDNMATAEGEWLHIAFNDKGMGHTNLQWRSLSLPHDWCVEQQYVNDNSIGARPGSHGFLPTGIGFYRKQFTIDKSGEGKKWTVNFDGVTGVSTVWVSGHQLGEHRGGYIGFSYDLTDILRYGDEGKNVILIKVDATDYEGWWYEGCGIYRNVWLEQTDKLHVAEHGTYITTPVITATQAEIHIETRLKNEYTVDKQVNMVTELYDAVGQLLSTDAVDVTVDWYKEVVVAQVMTVDQPELWSPDTPVLYTAITTLYIDEICVDQYETTFGIRSIHFDPNEGFFLNDQHLPIKGTCNHQDFAGVGVALPVSLIEYKIKLLKEMGCNAYRSAHHPPTPELLEICDRLGMLVMDENRKLDSSPNGLWQLERLIYRDRNHPSVIIWSMENEEILEGTVMGARILKTLVDTTKRLDPTRPTLAAMNHGWNEGGYADVADIVGYNYGQREDQDVRDHETYPNRIIIGSESASFTVTRGIYEDDQEKGYCSMYGTDIPSWSCSVEKAWGDVVRHPFLTGVFMWTGFDYRGEPTPHLWPCVNSHFGLMDTCGFPKDVYYYMQAAWTDEPVVHLFPHWNLPDKVGKEIEVRIFANTETVELVLNGRSLGERVVDRNDHLAWKVTYEPGELKAIGKTNGQVIKEYSVVTTGAAHQIALYPNREAMVADHSDTIPVRVAILDEHGHVIPTADNEVQFSVAGSGHLLGVGNGDPSSHESDKASYRRAFNGWCLALIQAGDAAGSVTLTATAPGLKPAEVVLQVEKNNEQTLAK